jgi:cell division protein FtsB
MPPARARTAASRGYASRPRARPAARPSLRIRWERVGRVVLIIVLAVVFGLYVQQGLAFLSARSQAGEQQSILRQLTQERARLIHEQRALNNPATIELYARRLGMVKQGERPYVVTGMPGG